jgi:hypothetical protein
MQLKGKEKWTPSYPHSPPTGQGGPEHSENMFSRSESRTHCCQTLWNGKGPSHHPEPQSHPQPGCHPTHQGTEGLLCLHLSVLAGLHSHLWEGDTAQKPPTRKSIKPLCNTEWKERGHGIWASIGHALSHLLFSDTVPAIRGQGHTYEVKEKVGCRTHRAATTVKRSVCRGHKSQTFTNYNFYQLQNFSQNLGDFSPIGTGITEYSQAKK